MSAQKLGSRAILGRLYQRLAAAPTGWVDRMSFFINSDQEEEEHRWLGMSPEMREWVGGRFVKGLRDYGVKIRNKPFEASIAVMVDELRRDKTGQVMARVDGLANRANTHGAKLLSDLLTAAETSVCYDGQYYFDTDHAEGDSGTQSNIVSIDISALPASVHGSTTKPSPEEMQLCILQGIERMLGFKDDQGAPMNEMATDFLVMVPTGLWAAGVTATSVASLASGQTNVLASMPNFKLSVVPNPRLTWTTDFSIFDVTGNDGIAPFIRQEEKALEVKYQAEGSAEEFYNNRHVYGVDLSGNIGYGFWQKGVKVKMT